MQPLPFFPHQLGELALQDEGRGRSMEGGQLGSVWSATWGQGRLSRATSRRSVRSAHAVGQPGQKRVVKLRQFGLETAFWSALSLGRNALHWLSPRDESLGPPLAALPVN